MAQEDYAMKQLFRHNEVVAGVLNHVLASDTEYFLPQWFMDANPDELAVIQNQLDGTEAIKERFRDVCRVLAWQSDGKRNYLFLGIEHQSFIDPFMALRVAVMNIMNYDNQRRLFMDSQKRLPWTASRRRRALEQLKEGKVLHPVLTIVVYTGKESWDAPRSLREMLPAVPLLAETDIPDFEMRLVSLRDFPEKSLPFCEKNFRTMIKYLKCEGDPDALAKLLENDPDFKAVPADTARAIREITKSKIEIPENQETVNMCYAQKMLLKREWEAGLKDGIEKGLRDGLEKGREDEKLHVIQAVTSLAKNGNLTMEQLEKLLQQMYGLTQEEALAYMSHVR